MLVRASRSYPYPENSIKYIYFRPVMSIGKRKVTKNTKKRRGIRRKEFGKAKF